MANPLPSLSYISIGGLKCQFSCYTHNMKLDKTLGTFCIKARLVSVENWLTKLSKYVLANSHPMQSKLIINPGTIIEVIYRGL